MAQFLVKCPNCWAARKQIQNLRSAIESMSEKTGEFQYQPPELNCELCANGRGTILNHEAREFAHVLRIPQTEMRVEELERSIEVLLAALSKLKEYTKLPEDEAIPF